MRDKNKKKRRRKKQSKSYWRLILKVAWKLIEYHEQIIPIAAEVLDWLKDQF